VKARLEIAKAAMTAAKGGWERDFENEFTAIDKILGAMPADELTKVATLVAEVRFLKAERKFNEFKAVVLEFPVRTLKKRIEEKAALRGEAEKLYREVIDTKIAEWSAAAACRLGEMALDFRDSFKNLPIPDEVKGDEAALDEYTFWIEEELIVPAEQAATNNFIFAVDLAHQLKVYNEWSRKSARYLATLSPAQFPQLSGVEGNANWSLIELGAKPLAGAAERGPKDAPAPTTEPSPTPEPTPAPAAESAGAAN